MHMRFLQLHIHIFVQYKIVRIRCTVALILLYFELFNIKLTSFKKNSGKLMELVEDIYLGNKLHS